MRAEMQVDAFRKPYFSKAGYLAMYLMPPALRIPVTVGVALIGLFVTGLVSAIVSGSPKLRPILRNVLGGSAAMALTWAIGHLFEVGLA